MESLRKGRGIWKVRAMPRWQILSGVRPQISSPRNRTEPAVGGSVPDTQLNSVVWPEPLGPISPRISPSPPPKDTRLSAVNHKKRLVTPATVSMSEREWMHAFERRLSRRNRIPDGGGSEGAVEAPSHDLSEPQAARTPAAAGGAGPSPRSSGTPARTCSR